MLNALPLDVKNQVQALGDADQIANRKLTTDELMDRVKRLFEMREQKRKETWRQNQHDGPTASPAAARSTASAHGGSAAQHASRGNSMPTSPLANRRASAAAVTSHASPVAGVDGIKQTTAALVRLANNLAIVWMCVQRSCMFLGPTVRSRNGLIVTTVAHSATFGLSVLKPGVDTGYPTVALATIKQKTACPSPMAHRWGAVASRWYPYWYQRYEPFGQRAAVR